MRKVVSFLTIAVVAYIVTYSVGINLLRAAPRIKEVPEVREPDRVPGYWHMASWNEPCLIVGPKELQIILVFPTDEMATGARRHYKDGDVMVGIGKLGSSGSFTYLYVERLDPP